LDDFMGQLDSRLVPRRDLLKLSARKGAR
jgi:hypothetical protein